MNKKDKLIKESANIKKRQKLLYNFLKSYDYIYGEPEQDKKHFIDICNLLVESRSIDINSKIVTEGKMGYYKNIKSPYRVCGGNSEYIKSMEWDYGYSLSAIEDIEKEII